MAIETATDPAIIKAAAKAKSDARHAARSPEKIQAIKDKAQARKDARTGTSGTEAPPETPPTPDVNTGTAETESVPERGVTTATLAQEATFLNNTILNDKGAKIQEKQKKKQKLTEPERELVTLFTMRGAKVEHGTLKFENDKGESTPLSVDGVGSVVGISVNATDNTKFDCVLPGASRPITVDRSRIEAAQIKANGDKIAENFSGKSQELIKLWMRSETDPSTDAFDGETPEYMSSLLKETAKEVGFPPTTDALRRWYPKPGDSASEAEKQTWEDFDKLLSRHTLADGKMVAEILQNPNLYQGLINNAKNEIKGLRRSAGNKEYLDEAGKAADDLKNEEIWLARLEKMKSEGGQIIQEVFAKVEGGEIDPALIEFSRALESDDPEKLFKSLSPAIEVDEDKPGDTPEQKAVKAEKRKKRGLNLTMLLLGLLGTGIAKTGEFTGSELGGR